ncbi:uncharacterized protein LOC105426405 [Pogonomyrmex barbatus]|uniref:Uncharacterized protein LOC105426405 n=1 Tax=Pogonomyrmex barbatus TaxID=144034 RepID=A0A6I9WVI0_9HYME|nr:uncharacterized protein LOC105426405 [Pogonomyrmex barbatus]
MLTPLRGISTLAYIYAGCVFTLFVMYLMPTFVVITRGILHSHLPTNYSLPYTKQGHGYFWTVPTGFLRHFHLLFEMSALILQTFTTIGVDNAFGFYIYLLASTMRAMTFRLTNPLPDDKFSDVLRVCVAKHQKLMRCRDTLTRVYSVIIFWHILTSALLLCALIYEAMQVRRSIGRKFISEFTIHIIFNIATYSTIKLLQMFTYAWYGTVITNSVNFRNGIYFSEWLNSNLDHHVRTNVLLIMMQKPMVIKAFTISVDFVMFTNFVNTTMSYFFLLESVGDKGG